METKEDLMKKLSIIEIGHVCLQFSMVPDWLKDTIVSSRKEIKETILNENELSCMTNYSDMWYRSYNKFFFYIKNNEFICNAYLYKDNTGIGGPAFITVLDMIVSIPEDIVTKNEISKEINYVFNKYLDEQYEKYQKEEKEKWKQNYINELRQSRWIKIWKSLKSNLRAKK